ncbi:hypothetical protein PBRA_005654 [Plasmodiophora brassicae]|nr:hypothetical protein PBRA_005654 [Plasmodiophora brassicae]
MTPAPANATSSRPSANATMTPAPANATSTLANATQPANATSIANVTTLAPANATKANTTNTTKATLGPRKEINALTPAELQAFRDAMQRIMDNGTYVQIASDHGVPNSYCPHGSFKFLTWHRRFLARMETALGVPLPYWDWTAGGIPKALAQATYTDANGRTVKNPLYSGPKYGGGLTRRSTVKPWPAASLLSQESQAMAAADYESMQEALEGAHNDVHGSVGGDMGVIDWSAFDPIFWLNHMNVDRVWYRWQLNNWDAPYPAEATGALSDSLGTFKGSDMVADVSGWTRGVNASPSPSFQALEADDDDDDDDDDEEDDEADDECDSEARRSLAMPPTVAPTTAPMSHMMGKNGGPRAPINATRPLAPSQDPATMTTSERPGYVRTDHMLVILKDLNSTRDPTRIDTFLKGNLVERTFLFGMGNSGMMFRMNRSVDITPHTSDVADVRSAITFTTTNELTNQTDTTLLPFDVVPKRF